MSKNFITEEEIKSLVNEVLSSTDFNALMEAPILQRPVIKKKSKIPKFTEPPTKPVTKLPPVNKTIVKKVENPVFNKVAPPVKQKPNSQTIKGPNDVDSVSKPKSYDPVQAKQKQQMNKTQYQIFNIKMRLGKLGLGEMVRRFTQSIHDFDINITKNSKDDNDIRSYLSPAQGNLVALKGALESLEAEFSQLETLLNEEHK